MIEDLWITVKKKCVLVFLGNVKLFLKLTTTPVLVR